ncbi:MAG: ABC transporter substrate-binding protein [Oscillospiraceae bacterium]
MKKIISLLAIFVIISSNLTGCVSNFDNTVKIGVNLELTGGLSQYGNASLNGIKLATEEINSQGGINGKKIKLKILDNRSITNEAALSSQRLQHLDNVVAIIGPSTSGGVKASLGSGVDIPIITPTATADDLRISGNTNVYRLCFTDTVQGSKMGEFSTNLGFKNVGLLLNLASDYSINSGENFKNSLEKNGGQVTTIEYYKAGDTDFNAVLTKMKSKNLDAIYFPGYYTDGGLIIKQARQLGITSAFLSGDAFDSPELEEIAGGKNISDIYFTNHYYPDKGSVVGFREQYFKAFNQYPTSYSCLAYDSAKILYKALSECNDKNFSDIFSKLDEIDDYYGVTGKFSINENRDAEKDVLLNKIENGKRYGVDFKD